MTKNSIAVINLPPNIIPIGARKMMLTILSSIVQTQQAATNPTRQSAATENPMMMKAAEMPP